MPFTEVAISLDIPISDGVFNLVGEVIVKCQAINHEVVGADIVEVASLYLYPVEPWSDGTSDPMDMEHMKPETVEKLIDKNVDGGCMDYLIYRAENESDVVWDAYNPVRNTTEKQRKAMDDLIHWLSEKTDKKAG